MKIFSYVTSLLPFFKRNTVLEDLRITRAELKNNIVPLYEEAEKFFITRKYESKEVQELIAIYKRNAERVISPTKNLVVDIARSLKNVSENAEYVETSLSDLLEEDVIREGLTAKKGVLVRSAEQISFVSQYLADLLNYVYIEESKTVMGKNGGDSIIAPISPAQEKFLLDNFVNFVLAMNILGDKPSTFARKIESIPEIVIDIGNESVIKSTFKEDQLDPFNAVAVNGFTGNPIYHLRMVFAEYQANRYKAMKEKKKMLELRLLYLKSVDSGQANAKLEQEVEYIQDRITNIEWKMKKMEDSVS